MLLYMDEDFAFPAVEQLRVRGHDVLTAQEDGQAAMPDAVILARAYALGRVVLTHNRRHYVRLHRRGAAHVCILTASQDSWIIWPWPVGSTESLRAYPRAVPMVLPCESVTVSSEATEGRI